MSAMEGYECDRCHVFVPYSGYGGDGPEGEELYDVDDVTIWVTIANPNTRGARDLCPNCRDYYLSLLIGYLRDECLVSVPDQPRP